MLGSTGGGRQFVSWVHYEDFIRAIYWLIEHSDVHGVVNLASPYPVPNVELMKRLREAWGAHVGLPAPRWMLEIGAACIRTETELLLKSRRVVPGRLLEHGFVFNHPTWPDAARDLCREWKLTRAHRRSSSAATRAGALRSL